MSGTSNSLVFGTPSRRDMQLTLGAQGRTDIGCERGTDRGSSKMVPLPRRFGAAHTLKSQSEKSDEFFALYISVRYRHVDEFWNAEKRAADRPQAVSKRW